MKLTKKTDGRLEPLLTAILVVVFIAGAMLRLYGVNWGLPAELHIDETHFVPKALKFGTGDLTPHFFLYPSLYMYMLFVAYSAYFILGMITGIFHNTSDFAMQYFIDPSPFYIIGRSMAATLNVMTAVLVFKIGKKIFQPASGFAAAVLFLLSPLCVQHSHFITGDVPLTFFMTLSLYFGLKMMEDGKRKYYILAGLSMGFAGASKYTGALFAPTLLIMHLFYSMGSEGSTLKNFFTNINIYLLGVMAYIGFFIGCPYHLLDFSTFIKAITQTSEMVGGHWLGMEGVRSMWMTVITKFLSFGVGWPAIILTVAGVVWSITGKNKKVQAVAFFVVFYYVFIGRYSGHNFDRYWVPIVPGMCLLSGVIIASIAEKFSASKVRTGVVIVVTLLVVSVNVTNLYSTIKVFSMSFTQNIAKEWVEQNIPVGTRIAMELNGPQLSATVQAQRDAENRTYEPGDINSEAEKFNVIGTAVGDEKNNVSATDKKYVTMALEKKEKQYYIYQIFSLGSHSLDYYRSHGYEYIISNDGMRDRYMASPQEYPETVNFYKSLDDHVELIKTIAPEKGKSTGPEIWIYRIQ